MIKKTLTTMKLQLQTQLTAPGKAECLPQSYRDPVSAWTCDQRMSQTSHYDFNRLSACEPAGMPILKRQVQIRESWKSLERCGAVPEITEISMSVFSFCFVLTDAALTPPHTLRGASRSETVTEEEEEEEVTGSFFSCVCVPACGSKSSSSHFMLRCKPFEPFVVSFPRFL